MEDLNTTSSNELLELIDEMYNSLQKNQLNNTQLSNFFTEISFFFNEKALFESSRKCLLYANKHMLLTIESLRQLQGRNCETTNNQKCQNTKMSS